MMDLLVRSEDVRKEVGTATTMGAMTVASTTAGVLVREVGDGEM